MMKMVCVARMIKNRNRLVQRRTWLQANLTDRILYVAQTMPQRLYDPIVIYDAATLRSPSPRNTVFWHDSWFGRIIQTNDSQSGARITLWTCKVQDPHLSRALIPLGSRVGRDAASTIFEFVGKEAHVFFMRAKTGRSIVVNDDSGSQDYQAIVIPTNSVGRHHRKVFLRSSLGFDQVRFHPNSI